ncbi:glutaminyl-peptide cyclotransferase [Kaistella jeonii]|uniref:Glutamine cyclotransferase n=1 Tax=Kaistella jeonii TaxID=266749 RepID=A0A0C1EZ30_9FLAO|nr:glutaminyl-peptide cyclotransferase [Kaistella jeonii]KIA86062.1 glutamine cyclotransferase [Kaistella jeonii]SFC34500.1 Glutamine cyclotransferase [Kaistella jeonii]VEI95314.1 Glutamine cyclotransferase [Kaistella jeonii]
MKLRTIIPILAFAFLISCNKDKEILNTLNDYNTSMESKGYHFGDPLNLPKEVTSNAESVSISFGDKETSSLVVDPKFFTLGDNAVTFIIKKKGGETLNQDATINVFAKNPEATLNYDIIKEYPHDPKNFVQGFQLEGNTIYESDGQLGESRILKYTLGSTTPIAETKQPSDIFSEGCAIVGDKIYQLTWQNKKGFIYDKNSLKLLSEFPYPNVMGEGWGLTYDGKNLVASDGTKNIYFLNASDPSKMVRYIAVAGNTEAFDQLNELEYHNGFIYANVWQKPIILKINPANGEVVGKFDFTEIAKKNTTGNDDVLNGIAFKGENMLITGKNWSKIYEVAIK